MLRSLEESVNKVRANPESGIWWFFLSPDPLNLGSGMDKIKIWDPGSRINFLDQYLCVVT